MKSRLVSQREFAGLLGVTARQVANLREQGLPCEVDGPHPRYPIPEAIKWYVAHKAKRAVQKARPTSEGEAKLRLESARAELQEIELAKARGEVMAVDEAEAELASAFARVRSRLLNLPHKAGLRIVGPTLHERVEQARNLVDEVIAELHAADDVPDP